MAIRFSCPKRDLRIPTVATLPRNDKIKILFRKIMLNTSRECRMRQCLALRQICNHIPSSASVGFPDISSGASANPGLSHTKRQRKSLVIASRQRRRGNPLLMPKKGNGFPRSLRSLGMTKSKSYSVKSCLIQAEKAECGKALPYGRFVTISRLPQALVSPIFPLGHPQTPA